ncbi:MAG: bifunctional precorrin-2 dehydrogenase/sirohydrochlorin ferrochelatase [Clostridia bacterium]|nr:bifunctional precorrin-2 dehydrogenase/sirohydrochlorin ferrochelatase [Clostridia bacterium]
MFYPIFLNIEAKNCLVIGGGKVALRKVLSLLQAQAQVRVISPKLEPELQKLNQQGKIEYIQTVYQSKWLEGVFLVISALDDPQVARQIAQDCRKRNLLLNSVLEPELGNFQVPATCQRGKLQLAVSTGGQSPLLARIIKEQLEAEFGEEYQELLQTLEQVRQEVKQKISDSRKRQEIYKQIVNQDVVDLIKQGRLNIAKERIVNADCSGRSQS